jgi:hypothetical protein
MKQCAPALWITAPRRNCKVADQTLLRFHLFQRSGLEATGHRTSFCCGIPRPFCAPPNSVAPPAVLLVLLPPTNFVSSSDSTPCTLFFKGTWTPRNHATTYQFTLYYTLDLDL